MPRCAPRAPAHRAASRLRGNGINNIEGVAAAIKNIKPGIISGAHQNNENEGEMAKPAANQSRRMVVT